MRRSAFLGAAGGALAMTVLRSPADADEAEIVLSTATGNIVGTLLPAATTPAPVVLIVAGSGPTDRNGNSGLLQGNPYRLLATALAARGIASVRYDKRGVGASLAAATSELDLRFDIYVNDTADWLRLLRADRRFSHLGLAGHSEGSLIGMIAVQRAAADTFVSLAGVGRALPVVLREQLKARLSPELYAQADTMIAQLEAGQTVADPPAELAQLFRPSVQPYVISMFKYDPALELAKVRIPVTIVQGTADVQVSLADAQALKRADPSALLDVVDGMNHVLKYAPDTSSQAAILKGYEDPALPVDPHVVDAIAAAVA
ncbi:MAG: alpha/beta fold hydrolase [Vulcanimicrobiaceae bacterium]|jgi:alpha-beta hydrolase superfamily lysophospholipase